MSTRSKYPADPLVGYVLADPRIRIDDLAGAVRAMDALLKSEPDSPIAPMQKAVTVALLDDSPHARTLLEHYLRIAPSSSTCLSVLGNLEQNEGRARKRSAS